jgi:DnaJ-class molecular chaperone
MSESQEEREPLAAGDKAQPDADNAGEDLCPQCNGTGRDRDDECKNCGGSGKVFVPVGTP